MQMTADVSLARGTHTLGSREGKADRSSCQPCYRHAFALGLVVVLAVGLLWPQTSQAAELTIIRTSLTNGLRVVMNPVPTTSSVVVAMSYLAGSAHDPPTKRGTARLLEAMMFAGNQATGDGEHVKMLTAVGGSASVHRSPEPGASTACRAAVVAGGAADGVTVATARCAAA